MPPAALLAHVCTRMCTRTHIHTGNYVLPFPGSVAWEIPTRPFWVHERNNDWCGYVIKSPRENTSIDSKNKSRQYKSEHFSRISETLIEVEVARWGKRKIRKICGHDFHWNRVRSDPRLLQLPTVFCMQSSLAYAYNIVIHIKIINTLILQPWESLHSFNYKTILFALTIPTDVFGILGCMNNRSLEEVFCFAISTIGVWCRICVNTVNQHTASNVSLVVIKMLPSAF